jgi:diacylglycerol kinase family enzyme
MINVIVNKHAGDKPDGDSRVAQLRQALNEAGVDAKVETPKDDESLSDCADRILAYGADIIVAAGGDGTIAALAGPCHAAGARLGVIPLGTFNYFARAHGIPQKLDDAVQILAQQPEQSVALGTVNDRIFLNNVSIGLYPAILRAREDVYDRIGRSRAAAYWSVLKTLARRPKSLRLTVVMDGTEHQLRTPLAFIAASAYQLDEFALDGVDALSSGAFAILVAPKVRRRVLLRAAWRLAWGKAMKGPDYELFTAHRLSIQPEKSDVLVACDGEKISMRTPLVIRKHETPLRLIAPETDS